MENTIAVKSPKQLVKENFVMSFLLEFVDKTWLAVMMMAAVTGRTTEVILAGCIGLVAATLLGVLAGRALSKVLPTETIQRWAPRLFIIFGVVFLLQEINWIPQLFDIQKALLTLKDEANPFKFVAWGAVFIFIAEFGDKTQGNSLIQGMQHAALWVFTGNSLGLIAETFIAVLIGNRIYAFVPAEYIGKAAALIFIGVGLFMEFEVKERYLQPALENLKERFT